jgi:hypothetical protein
MPRWLVPKPAKTPPSATPDRRSAARVTEAGALGLKIRPEAARCAGGGLAGRLLDSAAGPAYFDAVTAVAVIVPSEDVLPSTETTWPAFMVASVADAVVRTAV